MIKSQIDYSSLYLWSGQISLLYVFQQPPLGINKAAQPVSQRGGRLNLPPSILPLEEIFFTGLVQCCMLHSHLIQQVVYILLTAIERGLSIHT